MQSSPEQVVTHHLQSMKKKQHVQLDQEPKIVGERG